MNTRLAGRVLIDEEPTGRKFIIPSKKGWQMPFVLAWLSGWILLPLASMRHAVHNLKTPGATDWFSLLWVIGWICGISFAVGILLWCFGGKECLRVTMSEVEFTRSIFGIVFRRKVSPTNEIRNLRYAQAKRGLNKFQSGCIALEDSRRTVEIGSPLSNAEGIAIVKQMLLVHPFPNPKRDRTLEPFDFSS